MTSALIIPPDQLNRETLENLVEEFVSRDGTDYGVEEVSLATRTAQVLGQLKRGDAVIVYDSEHDNCTILSADEGAGMKTEMDKE